MIRFSSALTALFALVLCSCSPARGISSLPTAPEIPDAQRVFLTECRSNMQRITSALVVFYAVNGFYPETLEELGPPYSVMTCPECGMPYEYGALAGDFKVFCQFTFHPVHGGVLNGVPSWKPTVEE